MTAIELIAEWSKRHPGRGGADLVELVESAIEAGRAPTRKARDAYAEKCARFKVELAAVYEELGKR